MLHCCNVVGFNITNSVVEWRAEGLAQNTFYDIVYFFFPHIIIYQRCVQQPTT